MNVIGAPRSAAEMLFFIAEQPCEVCGARRTKNLELDERDDEHAVYRGRCGTCGVAREFRFGRLRAQRRPPEGSLGWGDEPSEILSSALLAGVIDRALAQTPADPSSVAGEELFRCHALLGRARTAANELRKLGTDRRGEVEARWSAYEAVYPARKASWRATAPATPHAVSLRDAASAHQRWLSNGRSGEGRMVLRDVAASGERLGNADLTAAVLERCSFDCSDLGFARLGESELTDCSLRGSSLASAELARAKLVRCDLPDASLRLATLDDAVVDGGDWRGVDAGRGLWQRARVRSVDLHDAQLRDLVLDGAVLESCDLRGADLRRDNPVLRRLGTARGTRFVDCDFRGAQLDGWRLDRTTFERCQLGGATGTPAIEGAVTIDDAELLARWRSGAP